ncbi:MAG: DUF1330 domain-containing protein [Rhodospirillaceae bacterium]
MAAYIVVQVDVTDPDTYDTYRKQVAPTIEAFGGEFVVRGGSMEVLEGEWPYARCVVLKFKDAETAKAWHSSDAYAPLLKLRQSASKGNMIVVDGV